MLILTLLGWVAQAPGAVLDRNGDGRPDKWIVTSKNSVDSKIDRDFDGRIDAWQILNSSQRIYFELRNGKIRSALIYRPQTKMALRLRLESSKFKLSTFVVNSSLRFADASKARFKFDADGSGPGSPEPVCQLSKGPAVDLAEIAPLANPELFASRCFALIDRSKLRNEEEAIQALVNEGHDCVPGVDKIAGIPAGELQEALGLLASELKAAPTAPILCEDDLPVTGKIAMVNTNMPPQIRLKMPVEADQLSQLVDHELAHIVIARVCEQRALTTPPCRDQNAAEPVANLVAHYISACKRRVNVFATAIALSENLIDITATPDMPEASAVHQTMRGPLTSAAATDLEINGGSATPTVQETPLPTLQQLDAVPADHEITPDPVKLNEIVFAKPSDDGLPPPARIVKVTEELAKPVQNYVDRLWTRAAPYIKQASPVPQAEATEIAPIASGTRYKGSPTQAGKAGRQSSTANIDQALAMLNNAAQAAGAAAKAKTAGADTAPREQQGAQRSESAGDFGADSAGEVQQRAVASRAAAAGGGALPVGSGNQGSSSKASKFQRSGPKAAEPGSTAASPRLAQASRGGRVPAAVSPTTLVDAFKSRKIEGYTGRQILSELVGNPEFAQQLKKANVSIIDTAGREFGAPYRSAKIRYLIRDEEKITDMSDR